MARFGGQAANFTADDLKQSPGEDEEDLEDMMARNQIADSNESEAPIEVKPEASSASSSLYKNQQKSVSNYDISTALYGATGTASVEGGTPAAHGIPETASPDSAGGQ